MVVAGAVGLCRRWDDIVAACFHARQRMEWRLAVRPRLCMGRWRRYERRLDRDRWRVWRRLGRLWRFGGRGKWEWVGQLGWHGRGRRLERWFQ